MAWPYNEEWKNTKTAYFNLTGEKKPKETFAKFFETSHTKLSITIKKIDEIMDPKKMPRNAKEDAEKLKKLTSAVAEFKKSTSEYLNLLTKLIEDEKKNTRS